MPKKKAAAVPRENIDPTSADVVLAFVGEPEGPGTDDAPPRDLTGNDIARIAYRRALAPIANEVGQPLDREDPDSPLIERPDPLKPDPAIVVEILDELVATKLWSRDVPEAPAEAPTTDTPDAPADQPEG